MKKSIKNTVMIGMAAVLIGTSAVTYSLASLQNRHNEMPPQMQNQQMPDFNNNNSFKDGQKGGFNQAPPQGDNNQQQAPQAPSQDGNQQNNQQQAPQTPSQDSNQQNTPEQSKSSDNTQNNTNQQDKTAADMEFETKASNLQTGNMKRDKGNKLEFFALYTFLALQVAIILLIIIYLILSKFNTLSFNQVFPENKADSN